MPEIYLGLGSNAQPEKNLQLAVRELSQRFELLAVSPVYRNAPVGFDGDDFLNAVAVVSSELSPAKIARHLEEIHDLAGRQRQGNAYSSRTLDIDLLLYGREIIEEHRIPRADVLKYSFVLGPLAEMAPDLRHPGTGRTMAEHWADFDVETHPLTRESLILLNGAG